MPGFILGLSLQMNHAADVAFLLPTVGGVRLNDYKRGRGTITYGLYPSFLLVLELFLFVWS